MAEATNPITTASNPREDWSHLSPQEIVRRTRCEADDWVDIGAPATWRTCCDLILRRLKAASAPSPEAGAGGDLGGEPSGTGSREPGPTVPAYGFDPSRVGRIWDDETRNILEAEADQKIEATARTLPFEVNKHFWTIKAHVTGIFDHSEDPHVRDDAVAIKSSLADLADALALGTEARSAETFGLGPKDDGPACKATPKSSPSQTPVDPWATLRKIAELRHAEDACEPFDEALDLADAALRTLQAAGEVLAPSDAPSTTEADQ